MSQSKDFSGIVAIFMAFVTMIMSLIGIIQNKPKEEKDLGIRVIQGFEEKSENDLRIMSFNIRCTNVGDESRKDREGIVAETILEGHPDSLGVQEATPEWMRSLKKSIGDEYGYVGVGRDDGNNLGEYSAVFYLKDKYDVLDSGTFWLSETPEKPSYGWNAACKRICSWALLENKETGFKYVHLNSHFDHVSEEARQHSVSMIVDKAREYSDLPVVFTADMNVVQGSSTYNAMIESNVLFDTKFLAEDTMDYLTFHAADPKSHEDDVIDYIMINNNFKANVYRVVTEGIDNRFVSDHFPIYADLTVADN